MNVHVEAVGPSRKQLSIEVPANEVDEAFEGAVANYQRYARIPGFRQGKAPAHLVKSRFHKDIIKELKEFLIPKNYHEAIKEQSLKVEKVIDVTDADPAPGQPFTFSVTIDVTPEFELPDYRAIRVEAKPVEVSEESIQEVIDNMRDRMATYEEVPGRVAEKSDRLSINYTATVDGQPMRELVNEHKILAEAKEIGLILDPNYSFIPEFAEALVGTTAGATKQVEVSFEEKFIDPAVAGRKALYEVEVLKVERKVLPELTPEFFTSIGGSDEASIRTRIKEDLGRMKGDEERRRVRDEIVKRLVESTAMTLPESEVQRQTANEVYDLVQYNTNRGLPREAIEENREQIFSVAAKTAEERIKMRYILLKIAENEKLEASDAEVEAQIRMIAQRAKKDPAKVKAELKKNDSLGDLKNDVLAEKAMALLMGLQEAAA